MFLAQSNYLGVNGTAPDWRGRLLDLGSYVETVYRHALHRQIRIEATVSAIVEEPWRSRGRGVKVLPDVRVAVSLYSTREPSGALSRLSYQGTDDDDPALVVNRRPGRHPSYEIKFRGKRAQWKPTAQTPSDDFFYALARLINLAAQDRRKSRRAVQRDATFFSSLFSLRNLNATVQRVPSGRLPPRRWYDRGSSLEHDVNAEAVWDRVDPRHFSKGQLAATDRWLRKLGVADQIAIDHFSPYHTAVRVKDYVTGVDANLIDVGFGVSQAYPVVRSVLSKGIGPLYLEQPEVHLHPKAQAELGEMVSLASRRRQIIVETHSEHLINRARILVAQGKLSAQDVTILYVDRNEGGSKVVSIDLDEQGAFSRTWPDGFFDERFKETMRLSQYQAESSSGHRS